MIPQKHVSLGFFIDNAAALFRPSYSSPSRPLPVSLPTRLSLLYESHLPRATLSLVYDSRESGSSGTAADEISQLTAQCQSYASMDRPSSSLALAGG